MQRLSMNPWREHTVGSINIQQNQDDQVTETPIEVIGESVEPLIATSAKLISDLQEPNENAQDSNRVDLTSVIVDGPLLPIYSIVYSIDKPYLKSLSEFVLRPIRSPVIPSLSVSPNTIASSDI